MANKKQIEEKTEALLAPIAKANGVRIYDVEYVKEGQDMYLRAYIDKDGGVTIEDCETVSRALSDQLDAEDFIDAAYILEVSSPGLGRKLTKDRHLENSIGEEVELKTFEAIDGCKDFEGILKAFDKENITLDAAGTDKVFPRKQIANLKLKVDF